MSTHDSESGFSFVDILFTAGLLATLGALVTPPMTRALDEFRTLGAARYLVSRLQHTRLTAVSRSASTALRFRADDDSFSYAVFVDGNGNGLRTRDIEEGRDREIRAPERLADQFPGVEFGTLPGLPPVDSGTTGPGSDPIRIGVGNLLTFTPLGTSTPGSLYIRGPSDNQYVIRIFGETGKTRILRFDTRRQLWKRL
jgi:hypothetical protein